MYKLGKKAIILHILKPLGLEILILMYVALLAPVILIPFNLVSVFIVLLILLIFDFIWAALFVNSFSLALDEGSIEIDRGVLWKKHTSIPYERVQDLKVKRGPLSRILGLSDMRIETAGQSIGKSLFRFLIEPEGRVLGLDKDTASVVHEKILSKVGGNDEKATP